MRYIYIYISKIYQALNKFLECVTKLKSIFLSFTTLTHLFRLKKKKDKKKIYLQKMLTIFQLWRISTYFTCEIKNKVERASEKVTWVL